MSWGDSRAENGWGRSRDQEVIIISKEFTLLHTMLDRGGHTLRMASGKGSSIYNIL